MSRVAPPRGERVSPEGSPLPAPSGPPPSSSRLQAAVGHCCLGSGACPSPPQIPVLYFMLSVVSYFLSEKLTSSKIT